MKKSLVAVGVIVALGVVWTGSSWYIGKQLEGRMAQLVQQANSELTKALPEAGLVLSYENYQRGLFDSQMQLVLKNAPETKNALLPEGETIVFNENITHGPLPGLKHLSLMPGMASVQSELAKNSTTQPLFEVTKDKSLINAVTQISFDGATSTVIDLIPIDYTKDKNHFVFSGSTITADADAKGDKVKFELNAANGSINTVSEIGQPVQVNFNGVSMASDTQLTVGDLRIGTQKVGLQSLTLNVDGKETAALNGLMLTGLTELQADKKNVSLQADYTLDALKAQGQDFGSGKLNMKVTNLDAEALGQVSKVYAQESQRLLADPEVMENPELYSQKMVEALVATFPQLLKGNPTLSIAPLSWKNAKGEATFNLALTLKEPQQSDTIPDSAETMLGRYLTSLDTRLVVPMDMATQLVSQVGQLEGATPEEAEKAATEQVKGLAAMGQMFHITKVEDNNITATLTFADNKAALNGEAVPLSDLFGALPLGLSSEEEEAPEVPELSEPETEAQAELELEAPAPAIIVPNTEPEAAPQQ